MSSLHFFGKNKFGSFKVLLCRGLCTNQHRDRCVCDGMVAEFTITYAIKCLSPLKL